MDELISRSALLKLFRRNSITDKITFSDGKSINETIETFPAVDAVEVVRCGECKFLYTGYKDNFHYCRRLQTRLVKVMFYDFCSYGERRNDGEV